MNTTLKESTTGDLVLMGRFAHLLVKFIREEGLSTRTHTYTDLMWPDWRRLTIGGWPTWKKKESPTEILFIRYEDFKRICHRIKPLKVGAKQGVAPGLIARALFASGYLYSSQPNNHDDPFWPKGWKRVFKNEPNTGYVGFKKNILQRASE